MTHPTCACGCDRTESSAAPVQQTAGSDAGERPGSLGAPDWSMHSAADGVGSVLTRARLSRRSVLTGSAAAVAGLALAACSSPADPTTSTPTPTTPSPSTATSKAPTPGSDQPNETAQAPQGQPLTSTSDVALGGGVILTAAVGTVVVTHPADSEFKAFNGRCPHMGCPVASVADNTITCNCHGSTFDAVTGDRTGGPAPKGLTPLAITVEGDAIYLA